MTVYIEYVFLDNFCVDVVLLLLVAKMVHAKPKWWLVVLSALFGTAVAFVLPLFRLPIYASIPLKLVLGAGMSTIVLVGQPKIVKMVGYVLFLVSTFALGGMTIAFLYFLTKTPLEAFALGYGGEMPVGLTVLATFFLLQGFLYLIKYVKERRTISPFLQTIILSVDGHKMELAGFMDSGNRLEDDRSGLPIVVVEKKALLSHLPKEWKQTLETGQLPKKCKAHFVEAQTATSKAKMLVFYPDFLHLGNQKKSALLGVSNEKFSEVVKVEALFGPALV